jgi:hypothetical protein
MVPGSNAKFENIGQPYLVRQQPIVLIFLPVIEHIKWYHPRYFSVLVIEKNLFF